MHDNARDDDWPTLRRFLPAGWAEQAKRLGAMRRQRKVANAEQLLRVLLIHLVDGCSLRETVVRARAGGLARITDVALLEAAAGGIGVVALDGGADAGAAWLRGGAAGLAGGFSGPERRCHGNQ